eukprot:scaffold46115_cov66-Phaeocystis_antarctica.AAC.2
MAGSRAPGDGRAPLSALHSALQYMVHGYGAFVRIAGSRAPAAVAPRAVRPTRRSQPCAAAGCPSGSASRARCPLPRPRAPGQGLAASAARAPPPRPRHARRRLGLGLGLGLGVGLGWFIGRHLAEHQLAQSHHVPARVVELGVGPDAAGEEERAARHLARLEGRLSQRVAAVLARGVQAGMWAGRRVLVEGGLRRESAAGWVAVRQHGAHVHQLGRAAAALQRLEEVAHAVGVDAGKGRRVGAPPRVQPGEVEDVVGTRALDRRLQVVYRLDVAQKALRASRDRGGGAPAQAEDSILRSLQQQLYDVRADKTRAAKETSAEGIATTTRTSLSTDRRESDGFGRPLNT